MMSKYIEIRKIGGIEIWSDQTYFDNRGFFNKIFTANPRRQLILDSLAISNNEAAGTLRGLHFQYGIYSEEKIIKCIRGKIFDVVVDLRRDSKTFGRWSSLVLTEDEPKTIFLPIGIAHGFQSLEDASQVFYGITKKYDPENSSTIRFDDSDLNIDWPMEVKNISEKDLGGSSFSEAVKRFK